MSEKPVVPDTQAAIEFLQRWSDGPYVLCAATPDRTAMLTATFTRDELQTAYDWIKSFQGQRNLYFHVNPCTRPMTSKAERTDIKELAWLHVDIDPRVGESMEKEQRRALTLLQNPPGSLPKPTVIIFSGGGYQGFWKLSEPVPINGNLDLAEDAKLYNQQLEVLFGADNCHDVSRIMRLPGTINVPGKRKLEKGRKPSLALLIEFDDSRVYSIDQFQKSRPVQMRSDAGPFVPEARHISENHPPLSSVDDLDRWRVPDRTKVIIVTGRHFAEGPKPRDDSRSAWLFDALCGMARADVPAEVMFAVVTDPGFAISESVLDKGTNAEKYARRQIQRAIDESKSPELRQMNERHAVIENYGGRCVIVEEFDGPTGPTLQAQSFGDFKNRYCNKRVVVGSKQGVNVTVPLGKWWLDHEDRRQFSRIVFSPSRDIPGCYNLWKGFACDARPGDCSLFLSHIRDNLCGGSQVLYDYLLKWMALTVQRPDQPGHVAIVLRGEQGTGKGCFAKNFGSLFGRHFSQISDAKHLVGNFNYHLMSCVLLFADEAFFAGDKKHEANLKALVTEETATFERKGVDMEQGHNFVHLIMASNSQWVVPSGPNERRFLVLDVSNHHRQNSSYFSAITRQMNQGGREALLHMLLNLDLSDFEIRAVPKTRGLREQQELTLRPDHEWWLNRLNEGTLLPGHSVWVTEVTKEELATSFVEYSKAFNISRRGNLTALGRFLHGVVPGLRTFQKDAVVEVLKSGRPEQVRRRMWHYRFPPLAECRAAWEKSMGGEWIWPEQDTSQPAEPLGTLEPVF